MKKGLKIVLGIVCCLAIFFGLVCSVFLLAGKQSGPDSQGIWYYSDEIVIQDGQLVAEPAKTVFNFEQTGTCKLHVKWGEKSKTYGYLTLMMIKDPTGEVVSWVSGDQVDSELAFDVKEIGDYTVQCSYYMSAKDFKSAVCAIDEKNGNQIKIGEDGSYDGFDTFGTEGAWRNDYTVDMEMYHTSPMPKNIFLVSIVLGMIIIIAAVIIVALFTKEGGSLKLVFDERQKQVQGNSYKLGFFTLLFWNVIFALLHYLGIENVIEFHLVLVLGILVAIFAFASYAIWNDAYFALNEKKGSLLLSFGMIFLANTLFGLLALIGGRIIVDGKLSVGSLNFACAFLFLGIFLVVLVKTIADKVKSSEEE